MNKLTFSIVLIVVTLAAAGLILTGCSNKKSGHLTQITITPADTLMLAGTNNTFQAYAIFSDGTDLDWTTAVDWATSDGTVATVGNAIGTYGVVTALAAPAGGKALNTITITATDTANNISGTATVIVYSTPFLSISVSPIDQLISAGTTTQYQATGFCADSSSAPLTAVALWSSSDETVATVSNAEGSEGLVTAVAGGTTTITASLPSAGVSGSTSLAVR